MGGQIIFGGAFAVGVVLVFDASQTGSSGNLILESGEVLSDPNLESHTIVRDVCVAWDFGLPIPYYEDLAENVIYVVGSTDTDDLTPIGLGTYLGTTSSTFGGETDGFIMAFADVSYIPAIYAETFSYWGSEGEDGLTGVNNWNEFAEHVSATGFTELEGDFNIGVTSFFFNNSFGTEDTGNTAPPNNNLDILAIRSDVIGGTSDDRPAVMGFFNAMDPVDPTQGATGLLFDDPAMVRRHR